MTESQIQKLSDNIYSYFIVPVVIISSVLSVPCIFVSEPTPILAATLIVLAKASFFGALFICYLACCSKILSHRSGPLGLLVRLIVLPARATVGFLERFSLA